MAAGSERNFMLPDALKAQQWERTKGELRALVALQGSYSSADRSAVDREQTQRWETLDKAVKDFISIIESNALQE